MKIIFLDIDGVLNNDFWFEKRLELGFDPESDKDIYDKIWYLHPDKVKLLNKLIQKTGAKVVLSSSWRKNPEGELDFALERLCFSGKIIDKTPVLYAPFSVPRGVEIKSWLTNNKHLDIHSYVILDDDKDMLYEQKDNFIHINNGNEIPATIDNDKITGLTENVIKKAIQILNKKSTWY
jgi:hypothetical protein